MINGKTEWRSVENLKVGDVWAGQEILDVVDLQDGTIEITVCARKRVVHRRKGEALVVEPVGAES